MRKPIAKPRYSTKTVIRVPAGYVWEELIRLGSGVRKIVLEQGAKGIVFERDVPSLLAKGKRDRLAVDVTVGKGAELQYIAIVTGTRKARRIVRRSTVEAGGKIHWHIVTLGGSGDTHELESLVVGKNATSAVNWVLFCRGSQKQSVAVRTVFDARGGKGDVTMKGVALECGRLHCDGKIEITRRGKGTNTFLREHVLLLDKTAQAGAVPSLVIRTNDVKAGHSASVSRVSPGDLFYLQSRGLTESDARRLFVEGFLSDLTEKIPDACVRSEVVREIVKAYERK